MRDPISENSEQQAAPFSADPQVARAELEDMRPRVKRYFQLKNVRPPHDEIRTDCTLELVWDQYSKGNQIRNRFTYTNQVARRQLSEYLENEGLETESTNDPNFDAEGPAPASMVEDDLY